MIKYVNLFYLKARSVLSKMRRGKNYKWSYKKLKNRPNDKDLILEIGSRDLLDSIKIQNEFKSKVIAFEPVKVNIAVCKANLQKLNEDIQKKITIDPRCLSDITGEIIFHAADPSKFKDTGVGSIFVINFDNRPKHDPDYCREEIQEKIVVDGVRFDESGINEIPHTIFMDVQGAELKVLKGFGSLLRGVKNIIFETSLSSTYIGGATFGECNEYLESYGFKYICSDKYGKKYPYEKKQDEYWTGEFNVLFSI